MFDNLTGREYLTFIGRMYLLEAALVRARSDELLLMMGLHNEDQKLTLEYSHGMKKKLALAAALLPGPAANEPAPADEAPIAAAPSEPQRALFASDAPSDGDDGGDAPRSNP